MYLLRGNDAALTQLLDALPNVLSATGGSFRLNRVIDRNFRVDSTVPASNQMVDGVLEVFLAGDATGENFNKTAAIELPPALMSSVLMKSTNTWCFPFRRRPRPNASLPVLNQCARPRATASRVMGGCRKPMSHPMISQRVRGCGGLN